MHQTEEVIEAVWQHARVMPEADPSFWRQDMCGAWIRRDHFARQDSEFGWKIESITAGVAQAPASLRPFHWRNHFDVANHSVQTHVKADRGDVPSGEFVYPPRNRSV